MIMIAKREVIINNLVQRSVIDKQIIFIENLYVVPSV